MTTETAAAVDALAERLGRRVISLSEDAALAQWRSDDCRASRLRYIRYSVGADARAVRELAAELRGEAAPCFVEVPR